MIDVPVLVPVNHLARAKGRLSELLSPAERTTLALITLEAVLHAAGPSAIVLTPDEEVMARVEGRARILPEDPARSGLNPQLEAAAESLVADGTAREALLILHADLPLVTWGALETLAAQSVPGSVVLVESRDGGTNAMLMRPPARFRLHYGTGSFARHVEAVKQASLRVIPSSNRELRLDLDTPADLRELLRAPRGRQGPAGVFLLSIGIEDRLEQLA